MRNLKLSNSDSAYSICLVKFYENCYFLDNHNREIDIQHLPIWISYYHSKLSTTYAVLLFIIDYTDFYGTTLFLFNFPSEKVVLVVCNDRYTSAVIG